MTNEQNQARRITKKQIAGRMVKDIGKDLAFIVTAPLVGQLPEELKRDIYGESQVNSEPINGLLPNQRIELGEVYRNSSLTSRSTNIGIATSIIGGVVLGVTLGEMLMPELSLLKDRNSGGGGAALGFFAGGILGFLNSLPTLIGRGLGSEGPRHNPVSSFKQTHPGLPGKNLGTVAGYLASIPIWAGIGAYNVSKSYIVQKYQDARIALHFEEHKRPQMVHYEVRPAQVVHTAKIRRT